MSWECPHQTGADGRCERRRRTCSPQSPGCVLDARADLLGATPNARAAEAPPNRAQPAAAAAWRACVLQHVPFEGLGSIAPWLAARGADVRFARLFESPSLPSPGDFDLLIALGGPMSVNDESQLPWLKAEKRLIARAVLGGQPVLGICLGAQLIASALGARVYPGPHREIGWFPVSACREAGPSSPLPPEALAFHWHGETFDLPPGAVHLARSAACEHQAFRVGARALGLQFHLEATPAGTEALLAHCGDELVPGPFVQGAHELRAAPARAYAEANALMDRVLNHLTEAPRP